MAAAWWERAMRAAPSNARTEAPVLKPAAVTDALGSLSLTISSLLTLSGTEHGAMKCWFVSNFVKLNPDPPQK